MRYLSLALAAVFAGCAAEVPREDRIVLEIGGEAVTVGEFERYVESSSQQDETFFAGDVMSALLEQFIEERLLLRAADDAGVTANPDVVATRVAIIEQAELDGSAPEDADRFEDVVSRQVRIEALLEGRVSEVAVTEAEIEAYYDANRALYERPETVHVSQILLEDRAGAEAILEQLRADAGRFEELAERHSVAPEAGRGGELGSFGRGELPPSIESVVFSLPLGRLSDVVETDFGYHVFRVDEKLSAEPLALDAVKDAIRVDLLRRKSERELERYVEELKETYPVTVHREHLSFAFLQPDAGELPDATTEGSP